MRTLKFIWEFRGPAAANTAIHQEIHLKEYLISNEISCLASGVVNHNDVLSSAYIVVDELYLPKIKKELKPHKAAVYKQD